MAAYEAASPPRSATGNEESGWRREPYARVPSPRHDDYPPAGGPDEPAYGHSRRGRSPDDGKCIRLEDVACFQGRRLMLLLLALDLQAIEEENEDALHHL